MNVISLRNDPIRRIIEAISALSDDEVIGSPKVQKVADLVIAAARQGHLDVTSLPFVVMGGLDGSDVAEALACAYTRWSSSGHPPAHVIIADYIRQLHLSTDDPLSQWTVSLAVSSPNNAQAVEDVSTAMALVSLLTRHGCVSLTDRDRAMVMPLALATSGSETDPTALAAQYLKHGGDPVEALRLAAMVAGVFHADEDQIISMCRALEDGDPIDAEDVPDTSWAAVLASDPSAAVLCGIVRDARLVSLRQRGDSLKEMPRFASTSGSLFGRLFDCEPALQMSSPGM